MIARRIGAAVAAAALIVGAVLARRAIDDAGEDGEPSTPAAAATLVCITELADVCRAVAADDPGFNVVVEDAGLTLDRLAAAELSSEPALWLTIDPFPAMVDTLRDGAGLAPLGAEVTALATTRAAVAVLPGQRDDILLADCAGESLWRCIGEAAGSPWTDIGGEVEWTTVRPSLGDVEESAIGLASFADAVAGYLGDADVTRARWEADTGFVTWLRRLARAVPASRLSGATPLATMATRSSALDVAATTDAQLSALGAPAERFDIQYPEPSMWVDAVLAVPSGSSAPAGLIGDLAAALSGWTATEQAGTRLPDAGTMLALRTLWTEAT